jgi:hypothetical protein
MAEELYAHEPPHDYEIQVDDNYHAKVVCIYCDATLSLEELTTLANSLAAANERIAVLTARLQLVKAHCCPDGWKVCEECSGCTIAAICKMLSKE